MQETSKKRGRGAPKPKNTKAANLETDTDVAVAEPLKGKGKRKPASDGITEKGKNGTALKKMKAGESVPEVEEVNEDPTPVAPVESTTEAVKKNRTKKGSPAKTVAVPKEPKAPRKAATKASASEPEDRSNDTVPDTQSNGSQIEKDQPSTSKRNRSKPSYKEEDLDEPEYIPKPSKRRAKAAENAEVKAVEAVPPKTKPVAKRSAKEAATTDSSAPAKPAARGRKKAVVAEDTADEIVPVKTDVELNPKNKATAKRAASKKEKPVAKSPTLPDRAVATGRGKKKELAAEPTTKAPAVDNEEQTISEGTMELTSSNGVTQRKRGKDKPNEAETDSAEIKEAPKGKKAKVAAPKMNKCATNYSSINFASEVGEKPWNFKISSWNVAGLRSWVDKGGLEFLEHERPDILCIQETKCTEDQLPEKARQISGYHPYWLCYPGGYAGVAIYSKKMPIHVTYGLGDAEQDKDGRLLTAEYEKFYLVCVYVPNAGNKLVTLPKRMRWDEKFHQYLAQLNSKKPVILCGDMNVAHEEIDLANPKTNRKNAGFTQEERDGLTKLLSLGFVDTFRRLYPDRKSAYTFWTYMGGARAKNVGWRLDYFIVSERLEEKVTDNVIRSQVYGSDHCPVTLYLNI